jgi:periplasmic divalent cation tolerance protein
MRTGVEPEPTVNTAAVVLVTFPSLEVARNVSSTLVGEGLAACVNLLPGAESVYRWEGRVEVASEVVGLVKTTARRLGDLEARYLQLHPYEVPEFLILNPTGGHQTYLEWLVQSVTAPGLGTGN